MKTHIQFVAFNNEPVAVATRLITYVERDNDGNHCRIGVVGGDVLVVKARFEDVIRALTSGEYTTP